MKPKVKRPKLKSDEHPQIGKLADLVGAFIEYWGFKSVQGRLWCYLYLSNRPLSSLELSQLLEISPSLVTQSVQVLLEYKVIEAAGKSENGMHLYAANPNAFEPITQVLKTRESVLLEQIKKALPSAQQEAKSKTKGLYVPDPDRVQDVQQMVQLIETVLSMLMVALNGRQSDS